MLIHSGATAQTPQMEQIKGGASLELGSLTSDEVRKLIDSSKTEGSQSGSLSIYPAFSADVASEMTVIEGADEFMEKLTLQRKVTDEGFLVLTIKSDNLTGIHSEDLIAADEKAGLLRRWRLLPGGKMIRMEGLPEPADDGVLGQILGRGIVWTGMVELNGKPTGERVLAHEKVRNNKGEHGESGFGSIRWHHVFLGRGGVARRETVTFLRLPEPPKERPGLAVEDGSDNFLSRLFKKRGAEGAGEGAGQPEVRKEPEVYAFEDLNFRFKNPGGGFTRMTEPLQAQDASLMLFKANPTRTVMIIAEDVGEGLKISSEALVGLARTNLKSVYPNVECGESRPMEISGQEFLVFGSTGSVTRDRKASWFHAACVRNGYFYQLIYAAPNSSAVKAEREALDVFSGFEIINPDRKGLGASVRFAAKYARPDFGISADFSSIQGLEWSPAELLQQFPSADFGTMLRIGAGTVIIPLDLGALNPSDEALQMALMNAAGIGSDEHVVKAEDYEAEPYKGKQIRMEYDHEGTSYTQVVRIQRFGARCCIVSAFSAGKGADNLAEALSMLDAVRFGTPTSEEMSKEDDGREAILINGIGLFHFQRNQHEQALAFFREALKRQPDEPVILANLLGSLEALGQVEEALALWESMPQATARNPDMRVRRATLLASAEKYKESAEEFRSFFSEGKRHDDGLLAFLGVLLRLNEMDEACRAIDGYIEKHKVSSISLRRWQFQVYQQAGDSAHALELVRALAADFPDNLGLKQDLVDALIEGDKGKEALALVESLVAGGSGGKDPYLLWRKGRALMAMRDFKQAKEVLEMSASLAPGDPNIGESLNHATALLGQGDHSMISVPIEAVEVPAALDMAMEEAAVGEPEPGFNSRAMRSLSVYRFHAGEPLRKTETREIAIYNFSGVTENRTVTYTFNPTHERVFVNFIEVLDGEGKKVSEGKVSDYYLSEGQGGYGVMATGERTLNAPVPGLKPGHTLRYQITVEEKSQSETFPFLRIIFASLTPSGPRALCVVGDVESILSEAVHADFVEGSGEDFRYWLLPAPQRFQLESYLPRLDSFLPTLTVSSTPQTWGEVGAGYMEKIADRLTPEEEVLKLAENLVKEAATPVEKSAALLGYVQKQINYQAIEFGVRAMIPNRASLTVSHRYGDCKDHSVLAHDLLKAVGIRSHLVLVATNSEVLPEFPSLDQFDHMILYLPDEAGGRFIDCTAKQQGFSTPVPEALADAYALVLDPESCRLERIPPSAAAGSAITSERKVSSGNEADQLNVEETVRFSGGQSEWIRAQMMEIPEADRVSTLTRMLGGDRHLQITSLELENLEQFDLPFVLKSSYQVGHGSGEEAGRREDPLPALWESLYFKQGAEGNRMSPFEIRAPYRFTSTITFSDRDFKVERPPHGKEHPWCAWSVATSSREGSTTIRWETEFKKGAHPKERFPDFARSINEMLDAVRLPMKRLR